MIVTLLLLFIMTFGMTIDPIPGTIDIVWVTNTPVLFTDRLNSYVPPHCVQVLVTKYVIVNVSGLT